MSAQFFQGSPTLPPSIPAGSVGAVTDRKKRQWTEAEVSALPPGEHDDFERKSGSVVISGGFYETLGRALSAFATSPGGHIILGVTDGGLFDGVDAKHGGTSTREWLEQVIPARVEPQLIDFRVHEVIPSTPSAIPAGKVVIVIDVSESRSNHQASADRAYYYRLGGRSERTPHSYLEERRARLTQPMIIGKITAVRPFRAYKHEDHVFLELKIDIQVENIGPVAATHWQIVLERLVHIVEPRASDYVANVNQFPGRGRPGGVRVGDRTLYPRGRSEKEEFDLGLRLRPQKVEAAHIRAELDTLVTSDLALTFHVATHVDGGFTVEGVLSSALDREEMVLQILKLLGDVWGGQRVVDYLNCALAHSISVV